MNNVPRLLELLQITARRRGSEWEAPCPIHHDTDPSWHIEDETGRWYCFAGDTKIITADGVKEIGPLAGTTQRLLTTGGKWVDAPIFCFGRQELFELTVTRNRVTKTITTTENHRWFVHTGRESMTVLTGCLTPGDSLESVRFDPVAVSISDAGVRHGIVFGDGYKARTKTRVDLYGPKRELRSFFSNYPQVDYKRRDGHVAIRVSKLESGLKGYPKTDDLDYLAGFLAGYIATDGHVAKDGTVMLNSSRREHLEFVRDVAIRLGIVTYPITCQYRRGTGEFETPLYRIHFDGKSLDPRFFLRREPRERFLTAKKSFSRMRWTVKSVRKKNVVDRVFCAIVEGSHAFALEDFILTGNCFGCSQGGSIVLLVEKIKKMDWRAAVEWLVQNGITSEQETRLDLPTIVLPEVGASCGFRPPFGWKSKPFAEWPSGYQAYVLSRGISVGQVSRWQLGYAVDGRLASRLIFPCVSSEGRIVGYSARAIDGSQPRYLTPDPSENPDHTVLFGECHWSDRSAVVVTEGAINALACERAGARNIASLSGSPLSPLDVSRKRPASVPESALIAIRKLSQFDRILLAVDPDKAGDKVFEAVRALGRWKTVTRVAIPEGQDAATLPREDLRLRLVDAGLVS